MRLLYFFPSFTGLVSAFWGEEQSDALLLRDDAYDLLRRDAWEGDIYGRDLEVKELYSRDLWDEDLYGRDLSEEDIYGRDLLDEDFGLATRDEEEYFYSLYARNPVVKVPVGGKKGSKEAPARLQTPTRIGTSKEAPGRLQGASQQPAKAPKAAKSKFDALDLAGASKPKQVPPNPKPKSGSKEAPASLGTLKLESPTPDGKTPKSIQKASDRTQWWASHQWGDKGQDAAKKFGASKNPEERKHLQAEGVRNLRGSADVREIRNNRWQAAGRKVNQGHEDAIGFRKAVADALAAQNP